MDGGHEPLLDAKTLFEQHMDDRGQTVGRAARVGNDMVLLGIILVIIDSDNNGDVIALGRSRDDDLFGARVKVTLGLGRFGE